MNCQTIEVLRHGFIFVGFGPNRSPEAMLSGHYPWWNGSNGSPARTSPTVWAGARLLVSMRATDDLSAGFAWMFRAAFQVPVGL